jgi:hypothetical protein
LSRPSGLKPDEGRSTQAKRERGAKRRLHRFKFSGKIATVTSANFPGFAGHRPAFHGGFCVSRLRESPRPAPCRRNYQSVVICADSSSRKTAGIIVLWAARKPIIESGPPTSRSTRVVRKSPPSGGYEAVADRALVILERSNLPANLGMTIDGSGAVVSNDFASAQAFAAPRPGSGPRPRNVGAVDHWRERGQARHVSRAPINEKRSGHAEKIIYVLVGRVRWPNLYRRRWCPLGM